MKLVNQAYELKGDNKLTAAKLQAADENTPRLVKKAEAYFKVLPDSIPMYDHYTPSLWLMQNPDLLSGDGKDVVGTLDRTEALFADLSKLLT